MVRTRIPVNPTSVGETRRRTNVGWTTGARRGAKRAEFRAKAPVAKARLSALLGSVIPLGPGVRAFVPLPVQFIPSLQVDRMEVRESASELRHLFERVFEGHDEASDSDTIF